MVKYRYRIRAKVGKERIERLRMYFKGNLGAPFIMAFIVLLLVSAAYLSLGMSETAESLAIAAYFMLVAGVLLQVVSYVLESHRREEN